VRSWLYFQRMITVNLVTCQDGAVQFSDIIQDFPADLKQTQSSEIMCHLPTVMYGVFDSSGNHNLNGRQFKTQRTDTITSPPKFGPLAQNSFWYCPNFPCHFLFYFLRTEILELTATKHLWTDLHLNVRNKFSFMNVLVQLLYSLRLGVLNLLLCHGPLWESVET